MSRWTGKVLTLGALTASALLFYAWGGERPRMVLRRYRLHLPELAGLRLLHLSDQHFGPDNWIRRSRLRRIRAWLSQLQPDLILLTGDFLHNDAGLDAVEMMLQALPPARFGAYAVLGNHDYVEYSYTEFFGNAWQQIRQATTPSQRLATAWQETKRLLELAWQIYRNDRLRFAAVPNNTRELVALLEMYGVEVLNNRACDLSADAGLWVAGVDDPIEGHPDLAGTLAQVPSDAPLILLTHNPDLAYEPAAARAALILAGHTHGGQVILPGLGAIHTQGTHLPRQKPAGHFDNLPGRSQMIVSRGMGESTPFRFRCPPEIVVIDLVP